MWPGAALRLAAAVALSVTAPRAAGAQAAAQNPSPMVENTRTHERLPTEDPPGARRTVPGPGGVDVRLYLPPAACSTGTCPLVIHFHGAAYVPERAVWSALPEAALAVVHLGGGSTRYDRAFSDSATLDALRASLRDAAAAERGRPVRFSGLVLTAFSAGHGAVRAVLRDAQHFAAVDAVLLLDGLHTGYEPAGRVLSEGGRLDEGPLEPVVRFARAAARGEKRLLITHSEIFPGTFASTTETADHLLGALGLRRTPVLAWGPVGMQQLGEARAGGLAVLSFAGNSAPDHVDHLHGMPEFLRAVRNEE